jgi:hypothetical protein
MNAFSSCFKVKEFEMDNMTQQQPQWQQQSPPSAPSTPCARRCGSGKMVGIVAAVVVCLAVGGVAVLKFGGVSSAFGGGAGAPRTGPKAERAASVHQTVNSQLALWRLQHNDALPDFKKYPNWEQFVQYTNNAGKLNGATKTQQFPYGPYMMKPAVNPFNEMSNVQVMSDVKDGAKVPDGQAAGFVMDSGTGRLWLTGGNGKQVVEIQ